MFTSIIITAELCTYVETRVKWEKGEILGQKKKRKLRRYISFESHTCCEGKVYRRNSINVVGLFTVVRIGLSALIVPTYMHFLDL